MSFPSWPCWHSPCCSHLSLRVKPVAVAQGHVSSDLFLRHSVIAWRAAGPMPASPLILVYHQRIHIVTVRNMSEFSTVRLQKQAWQSFQLAYWAFRHHGVLKSRLAKRLASGLAVPPSNNHYAFATQQLEHRLWHRRTRSEPNELLIQSPVLEMKGWGRFMKPEYSETTHPSLSIKYYSHF